MLRETCVVLLAALAALPLRAHGAWAEASSGHFVIVAHQAPERLQVLAQRLERFDQAVRHVAKLPDPDLGPRQRLTIYVVDQRTMEGLAESGLVGMYLGHAAGPVTLVKQDPSGSDRTLFHEYTHHLLRSNHATAWPFWLNEGFAEFFATALVAADGSVDIGLPLLERRFELGQLQYLVLPPLLETSDSGLRAQPSLSYARSWLLVHYLSFEPTRLGQLEQYLLSLQRGADATGAARTVFGNLMQLDRSLSSYAKGQFRSLQVPSSALRAGTVRWRDLSDGEQAVMPHRIQSRLGVDAAHAQELLPLIRKAAAPFPGDASAQVALAEAGFDAQEYATAEAAADRALAAEPELVDAILYKGRAQLAAAWREGVIDPRRWQAVRELFATAQRLDPADPVPWVLTYLTFEASGQKPPAAAVAGLHRARQLLPHDRNLQMLAAYQYLTDRKFEPARQLLVRIAAGTDADALGARSVLEKLDQGATAAALEAFNTGALPALAARF
jgi:tetratricopeptide (TPR) repeat protein